MMMRLNGPEGGARVNASSLRGGLRVVVVVAVKVISCNAVLLAEGVLVVGLLQWLRVHVRRPAEVGSEGAKAQVKGVGVHDMAHLRASAILLLDIAIAIQIQAHHLRQRVGPSSIQVDGGLMHWVNL